MSLLSLLAGNFCTALAVATSKDEEDSKDNGDDGKLEIPPCGSGTKNQGKRRAGWLLVGTSRSRMLSLVLGDVVSDPGDTCGKGAADAVLGKLRDHAGVNVIDLVLG